MSGFLSLRSIAIAISLSCLGGWVSRVAAIQPNAIVLQAEQDRIDVVKRISKPTLAIFGADSAGGGSGVVITPDGFALTNYHVVKPCGAHMRCGMNDGKMYDAVVVGIDPTGDVALIKLVGRDDFPAAELGDSDQLEAGQTCYVVGNPFVLATDFQPTVTYGIISGIHRYQYPAGTLLEYADCIQTDASINPGNSGGPLFNSAGQLVGINGRGSFEKRGRVNVGVGYAISINQIKMFMGHLKSGRIVDHATLGFTVSSDEDGKLSVSNILEESDAYRRGLRIDDQVVALGERSAGTVNMFKNILGTYPKGWRIPVTVRRGDGDVQVPVRLSGVHAHETLIAMLQKPDRVPKRSDGEPKTPNPDEHPQPHHPKADGKKAKQAKIPDSIKPLYEARRGYANYHFNRQHVNRLWEQLKQNKITTDSVANWSISGKRNDQPFAIELDDRIVMARLPEIVTMVDMARDLDDQLEPPGSGGMLVAMQMWRRFLTLGPGKFGEIYYFGTAPLVSDGQLRHVIVGLFGSFETRFYISTKTGMLDAIELYPADDVDPCELHFSEYQEVEDANVAFPFKVRVQVGDAEYGVFRIEKAAFSAAREGAAT